MILKADVCDRSGRLLLPAGSELAGKQLKIFRMWGVSEADIICSPDEAQSVVAGEAAMIDPLVAAETEHAVALLFRHNDPQHPMIRELMRICRERRVANAR
jgi:hypothetical protein